MEWGGGEWPELANARVKLFYRLTLARVSVLQAT